MTRPQFVVAPSRKGSLVSVTYARMKAEAEKGAKQSKQSVDRLPTTAGHKKPSARKVPRSDKSALVIPKTNPLQHEGYRRMVASMACIRCGVVGASQAAHVPPDGKGIKQDDRLTFPLCCDTPGLKGCHTQFDQFKLMPKPKAVKQGLKWAAQTWAQLEAAGLIPKGLKAWKPPKKAKA